MRVVQKNALPRLRDSPRGAGSESRNLEKAYLQMTASDSDAPHTSKATGDTKKPQKTPEAHRRRTNFTHLGKLASVVAVFVKQQFSGILC